MTITLICANCRKQETHSWEWDFSGWLQVFSTAPTAEVRPRLADLCSFYCLGFWAQNIEGFRRAVAAEMAKDRRREVGGR